MQRCEEHEHRAGDRMAFSINSVEYAFRWCPAGTFTMGSSENEADRGMGETQHQVTLSRGFWMLETPVTQAMWESVMGSNPSHFKGKKLPVEQVSWKDCQEYIQKLNEILKSGGLQSPGSTGGLTPAALKQDFKFSLPTEAQWEYACRAGTITPFNFGNVLNGNKANCDGNYPCGTTTKGKWLEKTTDVGSYPANAWGLLDMHGNVWEWCADWYGPYPSNTDSNGAETDPVGAPTGTRRVLRGGGWSCNAMYCRSAYRIKNDPAYLDSGIGLRICLVFAE